MARHGRDRARTEERILEAIHQLLATEGFRSLGVNRIAQLAGVDKVLIYRYFGGLEGAVKRFAESASFWPSSEEIVGVSSEAFQQLDYLEQRKQLTLGTLRALSTRPLTLAVLGWELVESNDLVRVLAESRRKQYEVLHEILKQPPYPMRALDEQVVDIFYGAGIHYLALSLAHQRPLSVQSVDTVFDWERLEAAIRFIHDGVDLAERQRLGLLAV